MLFEKRVQEAVRRKLQGYASWESGNCLQVINVRQEVYSELAELGKRLEKMEIWCIMHPKDCEKISLCYKNYENEDGEDCHTLTVKFSAGSGIGTNGHFQNGSPGYEYFIINGSFFHIHNGKYIPLTLKLLNTPGYFKRLFREVVLELLAEKMDIFKDILRDQEKISIPVTLNSILETEPHNKKQLFEQHYRLGFPVPKSINSMSLEEAYCKIKLCKKIAPGERQKIWTHVFADYNTYRKDIDVHLMEQYYDFLLLPYRKKQAAAQAAYEKAACGDEELLEGEEGEERKRRALDELDEAQEELDTMENLLHDYLRMSGKTDAYYRLSIKSARKMWEQHDALIPRYLTKTCRGRLMIPKDSPFYNMHLPAPYEKITTKKRLCEEGIRNRNCVASYISLINEGKCVIFSILWKEKRYTIEIRVKRKKFYLAQLEGYGNMVKVPLELKERVKADIQRLNEQK